MERQKFTELGFFWARSQHRYSLKPFRRIPSTRHFGRTASSPIFTLSCFWLQHCDVEWRRTPGENWGLAALQTRSTASLWEWDETPTTGSELPGTPYHDTPCHATPYHAMPFHTISYNSMHHAIDDHTNLCNYRPTVKLLTVRGMHRQSKEEEVPLLHISIFWPLTLNMFQNLLFAN